MAINWTEAQVAELVAKVVKEIRSGTPAANTASWDSTQYNGRKLLGVYATMEEAIAAEKREKSRLENEARARRAREEAEAAAQKAEADAKAAAEAAAAAEKAAAEQAIKDEFYANVREQAALLREIRDSVKK